MIAKTDTQRLSDLVKAAFYEGHLEGVTSPDVRPDISWQNSDARAKLEKGK